MPQPRLPLEGIRILDFTIVWAGPFATIMLGDMGAEMIRIDNIHRPDVNTRGPTVLPRALWGPGPTGRSYPDFQPGDRPYDRNAGFNFSGRHKKGATFALHDPRGKELFLRLAKISDVIMCNNTAGTLDKLGIGYDVVSAVNPRIIMIQFPGSGNYGPYRNYKMYGANVESLAGHTSIRGYPDADATQTSAIYHGDAAAGAMAAFVVIAALHYRARTGKGQHIDMSQVENVIHHLSPALMDYSMNRRVQGPMGNRDASRVQGVYRCQGEDNWLALSIEDDAQWQALCQVIGRPELAHDPRFADVISRYKNHDAVDEVLSAWAKDQNHYQAFHLLQQAGVPAGPVISQPETFTDPHLEARGFFEEVTAPRTGPLVDGKETPGTHLYPGPLFDMSKTSLHIRQPAPVLGQHNEYVYKEVLGLSDQEYQELLDQKLIGDTYLEAMKAPT